MTLVLGNSSVTMSTNTASAANSNPSRPTTETLVTTVHILSKVQISQITHKVLEVARQLLDQYDLADEDEEDEEDEFDDASSYNAEEKASDSDSEDDVEQGDYEDNDEDTVKSRVIIPDYRIPSRSTFALLSEKLPRTLNGFRIIVEWSNYHLAVRLVPGTAHGLASAVWSAVIENWSSNNTISTGATVPPLVPYSDASICSFSYCIDLIDYEYVPGNTKSPDASFAPRDIVIPPALPRPGSARPGYIGTPFPTLVFEVAVSNEDWERLKADGRNKAFSANTSIQVLVGVKVHGRTFFQCFWGKRRHAVNGGMRIMHATPRIRMNRPTNRVLRIPAALIFWGVPVMPPLPSPYLPLSLERLRLYLLRR